jgi:CRISPR-associated protein Cmr6
MPVYATRESKSFWTQLPDTKRARSLAAARFVTLATDRNDTSWRKSSCDAIARGATLTAKSECYLQFVTSLLSRGGSVLHARLQARLILDAAGGVLENGGICLDRTSGIPFIPGSAIKGCARRYAIHLLSEEQNPVAKAKLLARIAILFGYGDQEWTPGRKQNSGDKHNFCVSDFWLAMVPLFESGEELDDLRDECWGAISEDAASQIFDYLGKSPKDLEKKLVPQLPNLSGMVSFLPAFPQKDPGIQTDVLTPHHSDYYSGKREIATDDENPVPVHFPTVRPQRNGECFDFPLAPLRLASPEYVDDAKAWLAKGLELFGLGAKTNAGYGWFEVVKTKPAALGDYPNEESFTNAVIKLLNQPGQYERLKIEVEKLKNPVNANWLEKLKTSLRGDDMKKIRKSLREKEWFPSEWISSGQ